MKKAFLAGGAGFIGGHLSDRLSSLGVECVVYDRKADPLDEIASTERLRAAMRGCDTVFHLAANADISKAASDPAIDFTEGTMLTHQILEAMRVMCVNRIFYMSGSGVYGEYTGVPFTESHGPMLPISPYGASKLASEAMICAYCHMFGFVGTAFRAANVVGPRQTHGVGYDFVHQLHEHPDYLDVLGDGTQTKCYLHVSDLLDAILCVERCQTFGYSVYNVATDYALDVKTIAVLANLVCKTNAKISFGDSDRGWKGDVPVVALDSYQLSILGWRPTHTSEQAMIEAMTAMHQELCTS